MPQPSELYDYYQTLQGYYAAALQAPASLNQSGYFSGALPQGLSRLEICQAVLSGGIGKNKQARIRAFAKFLTAEAAKAAETITVPEFIGFDTSSDSICISATADQSEVQPDVAQLDFLTRLEPDELRLRLVAWRGLGQESADALLLYAFDVPLFAVNSRSYRLLRRHGFVGQDAAYEEMQELFQAALPTYFNRSEPLVPAVQSELPVRVEQAALQFYRQYYRLVNLLAKDFCQSSKFLCKSCPLSAYMEYEPCE